MIASAHVSWPRTAARCRAVELSGAILEFSGAILELSEDEFLLAEDGEEDIVRGSAPSSRSNSTAEDSPE